VEDEEDCHCVRYIFLCRLRTRTGLLVVATKLLSDKLLVLSEELGVELDIAWSVNTVDVAAPGQLPVNEY